MSDSLTGSVARLYRAGSEYSQQMEKLREATHTLLEWLKKNIPSNFVLPDNCQIYASGEFTQNTQPNGRGEIIFHIGNESPIPRNVLLVFSRLIASGWIDRLSDKLEAEATKLSTATQAISAFVDPKK